MALSAWFEVWLGGAWHTFDARHNQRRIGRILMNTGRDATDTAYTTAYGQGNLVGFKIWTAEFSEDEIPLPKARRRAGGNSFYPGARATAEAGSPG